MSRKLTKETVNMNKFKKFILLLLYVYSIPSLASASGSGVGFLIAYTIFYAAYYAGALVIFYFLISLLRKYVHWILSVIISVISVYAIVFLVNVYTNQTNQAINNPTINPTINYIEDIFSIAPIILVPFLILYAIVYFSLTKTSKRFSDFLTSSLFLAALAIGLGAIITNFHVNFSSINFP